MWTLCAEQVNTQLVYGPDDQKPVTCKVCVLVRALQALWDEVARVAKYANIGHEGSELLEVMTDARIALSKVSGAPNAQ